MKLLRTTALFLLMIFAVVLNWNCNDDAVQNSETGNSKVQTDGPGERITLTIREYVTVYPDGGNPYNIYVTTATFTCICSFRNPAELNDSSFTTPDSIRSVGSNTYVTHHYEVIKSAHFECATGNCNLKYFIQGKLNEEQPVTIGSVCNSGYECSMGTKYCGDYYDEDNPVALTQNTTYDVLWGGVCYVDDDDKLN